MEELKEALAWNYGKGLDEQSVKESHNRHLKRDDRERCQG